ncbi:MAG: hypothetical protein HY209_03145 [Candidatus Omnitrophica bacterium]|nr:hypothetical protein [Candidatus Omnitrophota bacterium]
MDRDVLNEKAFSLTEIAIGLAVVVLFLSTLWPLGTQMIAKTRAAQTHNDLNAIGQACRQYYMRFGQWPQQVSNLQPYFLSGGIHGQNYVLIPQSNILIVSAGGNSVSVVKPRGLTGRLDYGLSNNLF